MRVVVRSDGFVIEIYDENKAYAENRTPPPYQYSEEEYKKIATDYISELVDLEGYKITDSYYTESYSLYSVHFHKYLGEQKTASRIIVDMEGDGSVLSYEFHMIDDIPLDTVNPFDMERAQKMVDAYLEERIDSIRDRFDRVECNGEFQLLKLKGDKFGLVYIVHIDGIDEFEDGGTAIQSEMITLFIE